VDVASEQQHVLPLLEPPLAHVAIGLDHPAGRGHHEGPREVRRGLGENIGGVGHDDPAPGRRRDVDVVEADGHVGHHPEPGASVQELGVDELADHTDQPLALMQPADQLRPRERPVLAVDVDVGPAPGELYGLLWQGSGDQDRGLAR
jgi:hypothetical protein